jgi:hypothetical protein
MTNKNMDVREAVSIAIKYFRSLDDLLPNKDLRLEETTISKQGNWLITVSSTDPAFPIIEKRNYKTFEIDSKTKEVLAMKMRNPFAEAS